MARHIPIVFPVHPRVQQQLIRQGYGGDAQADPRVALVSRARLVLTDSGGIQEETTILGVPCLTLRDTTERPVTVTHGTNRIIGSDPRRIVDESLETLAHPPRPSGAPPLWDGHAAERIIEILDQHRKAKGSTGRRIGAPG